MGSMHTVMVQVSAINAASNSTALACSSQSAVGMLTGTERTAFGLVGNRITQLPDVLAQASLMPNWTYYALLQVVTTQQG